MRAVLQALTDELRRRRATGERTVVVSDESITALRALVRQQREHAAAGAGAAAALKTDDRGKRPEARDQSLEPGSKQAAAVGEDAPGESATVAAFRRQPPAPPPGVAPIPPAPPAFTLPESDKAVRWEALKQIVLGDATCRAHVRPGKQVVLGVGSLDAKIFFCGEAPGAEEEEQGEPFVGPAGQLLNRMIAGMGLARGDVYIGNIMNWRPEMPVAAGGVQLGNRPPSDDEMRYCLPYLRAQLEIVDPPLIVALGATAAKGLLGAESFRTLGEVRGRWHTFAGRPVMITYHPSYILRNNSNRAKRMIWEDLLQVMERAGLPVSAKQRGYFLDR